MHAPACQAGLGDLGDRRCRSRPRPHARQRTEPRRGCARAARCSRPPRRSGARRLAADVDHVGALGEQLVDARESRRAWAKYSPPSLNESGVTLQTPMTQRQCTGLGRAAKLFERRDPRRFIFWGERARARGMQKRKQREASKDVARATANEARTRSHQGHDHGPRRAPRSPFEVARAARLQQETRRLVAGEFAAFICPANSRPFGDPSRCVDRATVLAPRAGRLVPQGAFRRGPPRSRSCFPIRS